MTTTATSTTMKTLAESCPDWCRSHDNAEARRRGGGVTALHESDVVTWSDEDNYVAGIRRIDEYADGQLDGIYIGDGWDFVWDITSDQARRLAMALLQLADQLGSERSVSAPASHDERNFLTL